MATEHRRKSKSPLAGAVMARGTLLCRDLDRLAQLSEIVLGLEAEKMDEGRLIIRDRRTGKDGDPFWALDVTKVDNITVPQSMLNHWGITVDTSEEVDRAYASALEHSEELGLKRIQKPSLQHQSYSFYVGDSDDNWWEVEYREPGARYEDLVDIAGEGVA